MYSVPNFLIAFLLWVFSRMPAIVYVDDTLTKDSAGNPPPQTVLAQQQ